MKDKLPVEELEAIANEQIGEVLRRTRIHYGKNLADVEKSLRIRSSQIAAIEAGDMDALPGRVYAIGFVRTYGEYLGLDGAQVVALFKKQYMDGNHNTVLSFPIPASETKTPPLWLVFLCFVGVIGLVLVMQRVTAVDRSFVEEVAMVPADVKEHVSRDILESVSFDVSASVLESEKSVLVEDMNAIDRPAGVVLNVLGDCWVEIKSAEGEVLVSKILQAGDEYFVPDNPGLSMSLGNAAMVRILVDGHVLQPLGREGEVRKNIPLDTNYLKTLSFEEEKPQQQ